MNISMYILLMQAFLAFGWLLNTILKGEKSIIKYFPSVIFWLAMTGLALVAYAIKGLIIHEPV